MTRRIPRRRAALTAAAAITAAGLTPTTAAAQRRPPADPGAAFVATAIATGLPPSLLLGVGLTLDVVGVVHRGIR